MSILNVKNLHVSVNKKEILKGIDLKIKKGEKHLLIGPNGHGKSTLLNAIMGHPSFKIEKGEILFDEEKLMNLDVNKRVEKGLFLIHQNPPEIDGVNTIDLYRNIINLNREKPIKLFDFIKKVNNNAKDLKINEEMLSRSLNSGFSGGEKKRNELLQLKISSTKIALIDEIDSGLDVDGINKVIEILNELNKEGMGFLIVSHYNKMFKDFKPDYVHIIINGKIVKTSDHKILNKIDKEGYNWLKDENIDLSLNKDRKKTIGVCLNKEIANANKK